MIERAQDRNLSQRSAWNPVCTIFKLYLFHCNDFTCHTIHCLEANLSTREFALTQPHKLLPRLCRSGGTDLTLAPKKKQKVQKILLNQNMEFLTEQYQTNRFNSREKTTIKERLLKEVPLKEWVGLLLHSTCT